MAEKPVDHYEETWGGKKWSGPLELIRAFYHITPGATGWYLIIIKKVATDTIWFLLTLISMICFAVDVLRISVSSWRERTGDIKAQEYIDAMLQGKVLWLAKNTAASES